MFPKAVGALVRLLSSTPANGSLFFGKVGLVPSLCLLVGLLLLSLSISARVSLRAILNESLGASRCPPDCMSDMLIAFLRGELAWLYIPRLPPSPALVPVETVPGVLCRNRGCRITVSGVMPVNGVGSRELYAEGVYT